MSKILVSVLGYSEKKMLMGSEKWSNLLRDKKRRVSHRWD